LKTLAFTFLLIVFALKSYCGNNDSVSLITSETKYISKKPKKAAIYIPPAIFLGYGFISTASKPLRKLDSYLNSNIRESVPGFKTSVDDYLQFAPTAAVYGLNLAGIKGKHNFMDRTAMLLISNALMCSSVRFLKTETQRLRPSGISTHSFPSGHTATAFVGAQFLAEEYKDVSPWYPVAGYTIATATGVLRMYNNSHWFSDVVAGAGFGILSTKAAYLIYPYLKHKISNNRGLRSNNKGLKIVTAPVIGEGVTGASLHMSF
jgi:membrane-associated phospholipid phosphatase